MNYSSNPTLHVQGEAVQQLMNLATLSHTLLLQCHRSREQNRIYKVGSKALKTVKKLDGSVRVR
tara:strand:- start:882 stop:1073 length:192 start_codon:yes stop_codon:yes gene_type:complete